MKTLRIAVLALAAWLVAAAALAAPGAPAPAAPADPAAPLTGPRLARLLRGGGPLPTGKALAVRLDGTFLVEGHDEKPHQTRHYGSSRRIVIGPDGTARQDWATWAEGDTSRTIETTWLVGERVLQRTNADSPYVELRGREAAEAAFAIIACTPPLAVTRAAAYNGHGLIGGPVSAYQSTYTWFDSLGRVDLNLDGYDRPWSYGVVRHDPRRGTLVQDAHFLGTSEVGANVWPDSLRLQMFPADISWTLVEHRVGDVTDAPLAELAVPTTIRPAAAPADTVPVVSALAPGIWSVELPDADSRSIVAEFSDHVVLVETGSDVPQGERLRAAIHARFPKKPVRFVTFSHHHPAYTGGLRSFFADSAEVVCAYAIAPYVDEIAHANFSLQPDRWWKLRPGGASPRVDTLAMGRWRHADATNEMLAIDIGEKSHHTEHYVIFWFPRQKLLYQADLGWSAAADGSLRAGRRAAGLLEAVDEAKLAPQVVVQGWPVQGLPATVPFATFRGMVAARGKP